MELLVVAADPAAPGAKDVVRKTAGLPGERDRLLREAAVLREAAARDVAGVPVVVSLPSAEADEPCLVTRAVAGPSLAVAAPLPILEVAGVAAEVARLLSGLHDAGLVHGAVEPSHVVLDGAGGAILVGLGDGGAVGEPAPGPGAGALDPADDVAGWGLLVSHLLDWSSIGGDEPLVVLRQSLTARRARRLPGRTGPDHAGQDERRVLAALADQAQDPDPARRPAARSLAAAVAHRIPAARMPGAVAVGPPPPALARGLLDRLSAHVDHRSAEPSSPDSSPDDLGAEARREAPPRSTPPRTLRPRVQRVGASLRAAGAARTRSRGAAVPTSSPPDAERHEDHRSGRRTLTSTHRVLAGVAAVAALLTVLAIVRMRTPRQADLPLGPWPAAGAAAPAEPTSPERSCPPVKAPAADVDGDGCEEPVRWADGVLEAGPARFAFGAAGDAWALGDWDCDGRRTPALLHAGTLAVFDSWPGPGAELRGRELAAAGATSVTVVPGPGGCERPALRRPGAADLVVDPRPSP